MGQQKIVPLGIGLLREPRSSELLFRHLLFRRIFRVRISLRQSVTMLCLDSSSAMLLIISLELLIPWAITIAGKGLSTEAEWGRYSNPLSSLSPSLIVIVLTSIFPKSESKVKAKNSPKTKSDITTIAESRRARLLFIVCSREL